MKDPGTTEGVTRLFTRPFDGSGLGDLEARLFVRLVSIISQKLPLPRSVSFVLRIPLWGRVEERSVYPV